MFCNPVSILNIQMLDRDIAPLLAREKVLHKQVAAWSDKTTLLDLFAPKLFIETRPIGTISLFRIYPLAARTKEYVVLEQIRGQKRFTTRIERLKNHLRIIICLEIDDDDHQ